MSESSKIHDVRMKVMRHKGPYKIAARMSGGTYYVSVSRSQLIEGLRPLRDGMVYTRVEGDTLYVEAA